MEDLKEKIRTIPNWPKKGIMFRDVTTLFKDPISFNKAINIFYERYKEQDIDLVAGIESRGFILGAILANRLQKGFIPLRKKGKLPAATSRVEYKLEYGVDTLEIHKDAILPGQNVLIVDDLLATAGTSKAATQLIKNLGGNIIELAFLIELTDLKGREKLRGHPVFSLIEFQGE